MKELEETKRIYADFINNVIILSKAWGEEVITIKNYILDITDKHNVLNPYKLYTEANKLCIMLIEKEWEYITKKTAIENYEKEKQQFKANLNK